MQLNEIIYNFCFKTTILGIALEGLGFGLISTREQTALKTVLLLVIRIELVREALEFLGEGSKFQLFKKTFYGWRVKVGWVCLIEVENNWQIGTDTG